MCDRKTKYTINDIYDVIVKYFFYSDVVNCVLDGITMYLVEKQSTILIAIAMFH